MAKADELIKRNLQSLGIETGFQVLKQDAVRGVRQLGGGGVRADFVFLDPPYHRKEAYGETLEVLAESGILAANGSVIAEHQRKFDPGEQMAILYRYRLLKQGEAALSFYRGGQRP